MIALRESCVPDPATVAVALDRLAAAERMTVAA